MIAFYIPNKKPDEKIIFLLRRHPIILIFRISFWIALMLVPPILYLLFQDINSALLTNNLWHSLLIIFLSIFYLTVWLFMLNMFVDYFLDVWIVTNERILNIEQNQIFSRVVAEHELSKIQDVACEVHGMLPTFFNYGDVHIQTAAETQRFVFRQVPRPLDVKREITGLCEKRKMNESLQEK